MKAALPPEAEILFIVGKDNLFELDQWKDPRSIVAECKLLVADRICDSGAGIPDWLADRFELIKSPLIQISATDIRQRISAGKSIRYLVPDGVRNMIASFE